MSTREAETKGGSLESGTTKKESFHSTSVESLGMGSIKSRGDRPKGPVQKKAARGHVIR